MKFKYSAFTENTPEMREWLENIGKHTSLSVRGDYIFSFMNDDSYLCVFENELGEIPDSFVNCLGNPALFKAVTAIREDSFYRQWVICKITANKEIWHFCERPSMDNDSRFFGFISFRKPTLDELQNHFKVEH